VQSLGKPAERNTGRQRNNSAERDQHAERINLIAELSRKSSRYFFIDIDRLNALMQQDAVEFNDLSFACGKTIMVSKEKFCRLIRETESKISNYDNIKNLHCRLGTPEMYGRDRNRREGKHERAFQQYGRRTGAHADYEGTDGGHGSVQLFRRALEFNALHLQKQGICDTTDFEADGTARAGMRREAADIAMKLPKKSPVLFASAKDAIQMPCGNSLSARHTLCALAKTRPFFPFPSEHRFPTVSNAPDTSCIGGVWMTRFVGT
jgi:hypothetical protein